MYKVPLLLLALCLSLYPCALRAQTTNGSITGRVTDPSHAVIAEAEVAAANLGTNFRYETATNGSGEYSLANLPPGTYRIEVEKPGFKKLIRPDVTLHVQDALAIDFEMAVGSGGAFGAFVWSLFLRPHMVARRGPVSAGVMGFK